MVTVCFGQLLFALLSINGDFILANYYVHSLVSRVTLFWPFIICTNSLVSMVTVCFGHLLFAFVSINGDSLFWPVIICTP